MKKVISIFLSLIIISSAILFTKVAHAASFAPGTLYYVPVTITNSQSTATPTNFQAQVTVNSSLYTSYLASNLSNVNWQDGAGNILNSWLESGNSNSATASVYWVKLPNGIPANSSVTVYLCFYATSANNFNTTNTGEAPTLSGTYGQYDDGANVFSFYNNFSGTSLPSGWTLQSGVSASVNNGVTVSNPAGNTWAGMYNSYSVSSPMVVDGYLKSITNGFSGILLGNTGSPTTNPNSWWVLEGNLWQAYMNSGSVSVTGGSSSNNTLYIVTGVDANNTAVQANYTTQASGSGTAPSTEALGVGSYPTGYTSSVFVQWLRTRAYPPNNTMPLDSFGSVTPVSNHSFHKVILISLNFKPEHSTLV